MRLFQPKSLFLAACLLGAATPLLAQAPAGTTGSCKDGTFTSALSKSGACSGHGGVKTWTGPAVKTAKPMAKPAPVAAPTVASKPADATGTCGDGSFTTAKSKSGACSNHGGVKSWYAAAAPAMAPPAKPMAPPAPRMAPPAPKPMAAPAPTMAHSTGKAPIVAAPAGAPAGATAMCTDGTYSMSQHRSGSCSGHKGVKEWFKDLPVG